VSKLIETSACDVSLCVYLYVRYAQPYLSMDFFQISLSDVFAFKVTPKLGKNYDIQSN
jgi:hypothetical protein